MPRGGLVGLIALPSEATVVDVVSAAVLLALILGAVLLGRRATLALLHAREAERFRTAVVDVGTRIDGTLGWIVARVDAVRHRQLEAAAIDHDLATALERLVGLSAEAMAIPEPRPATGLRPGFGQSVRGELERADRAIRMIEHGCAVLGEGRGYQRAAEGETALKRGYLNLLHAREAIGEDVAAWAGRQLRQAPAPTSATLASEHPVGPEDAAI